MIVRPFPSSLPEPVIVHPHPLGKFFISFVPDVFFFFWEQPLTGIVVARSRDTAEPPPSSAVDPESRNIPAQHESPKDPPASPGTEFSDVLSDYGFEDSPAHDKFDSEPIPTSENTTKDHQPEKIQSDQESDYDYDYAYDDDEDYEDKDDTGNKEDKAEAQPAPLPDKRNTNSDSPMFASKPSPPHLKLEKVDTSIVPPDSDPSRIETPQSAQPGTSPQLNKPLPKSPGQGSPFASLFGWRVASPSATEFSSTSPVSPSRNGAANDTPYTTISNSPSEDPKAHAGSDNALSYRESYLSTPALSIAATVAQVEEMEDDLKAISVELASSIRREMDLEDLVDRLQEQINNPQAPGRRTSDYYSDSGYSSAKLSEYDQGREEVERIQRKSEQEKASLRLELTSKLQDERTKRKELDEQIKELAEKASQVDLTQTSNEDVSDRVKELESTCEDLRRRLSEERTVKNNFEDLLSALKSELQTTSNERDNLRDEVVPQLRARVEGLEAEAAEYANLEYESTKMQQQLQNLMKENDTLKHSARSGAETPPNRMSRSMSGGGFGGLTRSNSVATGSFRSQRPPNLGGLSRSNSVKSAQVESREALAERLKDVEAQRDALHGALKNLLERQEFQNRENEKRIKILENERERLLSDSPRKGGFAREITSLRTEITILRRRAEEALEQKWQVEKGLAGLKMDLDRAEEEIALLRDLLNENDILTPPSMMRSSGSSTASGFQGSLGAPVTSESLENAYKDLQAAYAESLERIKKLEQETDSDEKTQLAMGRLERVLATAVSERDAAKHEVDSLRDQVNDLTSSESKNLESERALADELSESARRVEELASQVRQQLATNSELRQRLSDTVARGDNNLKANSDRIAYLEVRLKELEDQLIAAQTASEERVARHEEEIAAIREAHNEQLSRYGSNTLIVGLRSPGLKPSSRKSPLLSPMASPLFPRSPRQPPPSKSFEDEAQVKVLRDRVAELEKALADAEDEMQDVVGRMSTAQIEVLNLQEEREAAVRETRRLHKILEQEQVKSFEDRFRSLSGNA